MEEKIAEKNILWAKYHTCIGLYNFLKGCLKGCRMQWEIVKNDKENVKMHASVSAIEIQEKSQALLFNCFLYAFCQHQFSLILHYLAEILDNQELKNLMSEYKSHFKSFNVIANKMKHLNRTVNELIKKTDKGAIQFYNLFGTKLTFGDDSIEYFSEEPLKKTEEVFEKGEPIILNALKELYNRFIKANQNS